MIKKKVKKIPKYNGGGSVLDTLLKNNPVGQNNTNIQSGATAGTIANGTTWETANKIQRTNMVVDAVAGGLDLVNMATSGQQATMGTALSGIAKGASAGAMFGPIGAGVGAAAGLIAGTAGRKNDVNYASSSTDINHVKKEGSGWMKLLGPSDEEMLADANRVQNRNIAKIQTEQTKADYMNNPNVQLNPVLAAEGGIMRTPVDALVSKGELIYNPVTKKLSQVPGSKGKPNKADDVFARLYEGDVVISNSPTMLMSNGKTPAQNLMGMVDKYATGGTVKAREAIIKKVVNWQEANKTKPQEYAMFDEGTGKVKARKKEKIDYVVWNNKFGYFDAEGGFHDMTDVSNPNLPDSAYLGRYEWIDVPIKKRNVGKHTSTELDFNTSRHTRDGVNDKTPKSNWRKSPTQEEIDAFYGYDRKKVSETVAKDRSERINNKNRKYLVESENENEMAGTLPELVVTASKINKASSKKDTDKKSSSGEITAVAPKEVKPVEINQTGLDWARQEAAKAMSQYAPNTTRAVAPGLVAPKIDPTEVVDEVALPGSGTVSTSGQAASGSNGSNWQDNLYRMAVLSQPLWDRAKAEPVNYESPVYKYMPTQIDVSSQLRDVDQSYALSRYNFANLYPNTGAGMAAGLQAASNRAKQYADIRQWQTNAQNELIGKNVGIYNNWANEHARILNDVYNKSAQNRATARNINRQNRAAALSNWGTMLSDDKKMAMERMKFNILKPAIRSTYEDATANDLMNMYNSLFG